MFFEIPSWVLFYSTFPVIMVAFPFVIGLMANKVCDSIKEEQKWITKINY